MPAAPVDNPPPSSRNAPCPCGSGRRYKECHGRLGKEVVARDAAAPTGRGSQPAAVPRDVAVLNDRGTALQSQHRYDEALQCFDDALARLPDHPGILRNRGNTLLDLRRHEDAVQCFARLVEVAPEHPWALGSLYQARMLCCDWTSQQALADRIGAAIRQRRAAVTPFVHLTLSDSPAEQLEAARIEASLYQAPPPAAAPRPYGHRIIRIAYVSGDFRQHAVAQLAAHLFESHDRSRFEVTAISLGPDTGDAMRRRLERAFDHFIDVRGRSDADVAALMRQREIDIAVDLMGYTRNGRPGILARRAAPVQVNYLGYAGTTGSRWMDYIIADPHVAPAGEDAHYSERVVRLPDTYFPHDPGQRIGAVPTRSAAGLPDQAFVFCCFNNNYKIMPATFDVWMRLLAAVDDAVLWLLAPNDVAQRNLRLEAARRGVDPARLVFASRMPPDAHLARHAHADLFVDTHHYNAHTTAMDALWTGLPLLTFPGSTIASRVAAAMLNAAGVPALVARDRADYETRALDLARNRTALRELRAGLTARRDTCALFDPDRYRQAIEAAYQAMWARHEASQSPAALDVAGDGTVSAHPDSNP